MFGKTMVFKNIQERDAYTPRPAFAWVIDATDDPTIDSGSAFYMYTNGQWKKIYETEVMDQRVVDQLISIPNLWSHITGKPSASVEEIDEAVAMRHTHSNDIQTVLDLFSVVDGRLLFDGKPITLDSALDWEDLNAE